MKVVFYVPSDVFGGGEAYARNLVQETLKQFSYDFLIITACQKLYDEFSSYNGVEVELIKKAHKPSIGMLVGIQYLNKRIQQVKPNVVLLNGLPESGALSRFIINGDATTVSICHSNEYWLRELKDRTLKNMAKRLITSRFTSYLDKAVVITEEAVNSFSYLNNSHCIVKKIYNGIPRVKKNSTYDKIYTFGRISRLCDGKGNVMLLRCIKQLVEEGLHVNLIMAGEGEQKEMLETLTRDLELEDYVDFAGHMVPADFFSSVECMVSPSDMEALPTVITEAMSCNIPIIATSVGGVPEMIKHSHTGYLVPPKSEEELVSAMKEFLKDPVTFNLFSTNALSVYSEKFSIEASTKATWDFING
jgi:glycosyltransferase involved in cell wall biosynthesis